MLLTAVQLCHFIYNFCLFKKLLRTKISIKTSTIYSKLLQINIFFIHTTNQITKKYDVMQLIINRSLTIFHLRSSIIIINHITYYRNIFNLHIIAKNTKGSYTNIDYHYINKYVE